MTALAAGLLAGAVVLFACALLVVRQAGRVYRRAQARYEEADQLVVAAAGQAHLVASNYRKVLAVYRLAGMLYAAARGPEAALRDVPDLDADLAAAEVMLAQARARAERVGAA